MCAKTDCGHNDERLIGVNGIYCISKLKAIIQEAEEDYREMTCATSSGENKMTGEINSLKTCSCGGAIAPEHALYGEYYEEKTNQLVPGLVCYQMKCNKCNAYFAYAKDAYEKYMK